jgi:hypothetical protein
MPQIGTSIIFKYSTMVSEDNPLPCSRSRPLEQPMSHHHSPTTNDTLFHFKNEEEEHQ